jgi:imidazolonepropionase-like amidohydrolase/Tol biopolymer transport system component
MSLTLSPDGRTLVFDLLGDLYALPVEGGEAVALTEGPDWDMQPTFSPDGRHLAFTSDRGGGDNLWVVSVEGSGEGLKVGGARAITQEKHRLISSPAWSPDGRFVAGRKHLTSTRSLGAGEVWLYPLEPLGGAEGEGAEVAAGGGAQMTLKRTSQKDEGEPAFSPQGEHLYWSQDLTEGDHFEYNKDSNTQIYVIRTLNRRTGEVSTLTGGPGGAARPTPSPDGQSLAFIRRYEGATTLWVRDLKSGAERLLARGLDRDLQETWAIHGVYPSMAWSPKSDRVYYWAGGQIRWVSADGSEGGVVPFRVRTTRAFTPPPRAQVEVWPSALEARALRWVSRRGALVLFQAVGAVYVAEVSESSDVPPAHIKRLPTQEGALAIAPRFTPDGLHALAVEWTDESLGQVVRLKLSAPEGASSPREVLTTTPGHYRAPLLSPTGEWLIYERVGAGWLTSPRYAAQVGLFALHLPTGEEHKIDAAYGDLGAHFSDRADELYFNLPLGEKEQGSALWAYDLKARARRLVASAPSCYRLIMSPDERLLAFIYDHDLYVTLAPALGRSMKVDPKGTTFQSIKISNTSAFNAHFSPDAHTLHWSLGPTLYERPIAPKGPTRALTLHLPLPPPEATHTLALLGARAVTMRGDEVIEDSAVLIEGQRIKAIGPRADIEPTLPPHTYKVNLTGHTLTPGLIDVHAHASHAAYGLTPQASWPHLAALAFGVTTLHDPSHDSLSVFSASEQIRAGITLGPRLYSTGTILYGADGEVHAEIQSLDDARRHLKRLAALGATSVKSYNQPRRDQRRWILEAARELQMTVVPEGGSLFHHNMTHVIDGHSGVEHALPLARLYSDVQRLWGATQVSYTPTFNVAYGGLFGEGYWYQESPVYAHARLRRFVPPRDLDARARRPLTAPEGEWNHIAVATSAKALLDAGVKVLAGAHGQREGLGMHWEMWSMVQGGFTPHEALRAATRHGAEHLGLRDLGVIAPGALADLIAIEGDPLRDIRQSEQVAWVVLGGALYQAPTLARLAPTPAPAPKLFFESDGEAEDPPTRQSASCGCAP